MADIREMLLKAKKGREEGKSVSSIDELACLKHPEGAFKENGSIKGSAIVTSAYSMVNERFKGKKELSTYVCKECDEDNNIPNSQKTKAHDCPQCGIVYGKVSSHLYTTKPKDPRDKSPPPNTRLSADGEKHNCGVCGCNLGEEKWRYRD